MTDNYISECQLLHDVSVLHLHFSALEPKQYSPVALIPPREDWWVHFDPIQEVKPKVGGGLGTLAHYSMTPPINSAHVHDDKYYLM